ncbi:MAG: ArnT family glycosyltransferase [Nostoc sp. ZfuVER08]|jgi:4-amino-4-deoxy-L-arabinose transferase-like glycosyltransferase|uniref:Glycosyltransferase family 39 protein n=1 Tax=Nostoc punctiforme FACHB-252 TaxID=1357509 RepID=A0ABR8HBC8_NOSPU|nr:glycosyltransferase family 39 protein [Nostoc punctiforme]MBD2613112.1 glycosyltransferase family 39 protein [Nostoc punctiforme FACHB-252]MBL1201078.1 glycosyltransferase family 39 protein [Nostoc sp. GBBB01]MDZ8011620.1 glycosyltransferase family 39 protein [Nostoc sp. ZfuVER08]
MHNKQNKNRLQNSPLLFLLTLAIAIRIYNINSPIIGIHSWRQSDTAAMARNFYENNFNLFYPQIDWGGNSPGYCETEFPIYSFIVALIYKIFGGVSEFWGRFFSILCFLVALYFLYQLIVKILDQKTASWSCLFFVILPLNVYYSRTFQPESMLLMCSVIGIYYFINWLDFEKQQDLILSGSFVALACLIKVLPIIYLGIPIFYLAWAKYNIRVFYQISLWIYSILILMSVAAWYYHAHQLFLDYGNTFGFWSGSTNRYNYNIVLSWRFWTEIFFRTVVRHFAIFGFPIFLLGLFITRKTRQEYVLDIWLISVILTWVLVPITSLVHEYYQLQFMLPAVIFMGKACSYYLEQAAGQFNYKKAILGCLCLTVAAGSVIYTVDYMFKERTDKSAVFQLAQQVKANTKSESLIIATTASDPTLLYLSHRKGWLINHNDVTEEFILSKAKLGAKYLVGSFNFIESYNLFVDDNQKQKVQTFLKKYPNVLKDGKNFIAELP